jgi:hypothetical protein
MLRTSGTAHAIPARPRHAGRRTPSRRGGSSRAPADCGTCAIDIRPADSLGQIAACAIPFELTPFGDLNALRRQSTAWLYGSRDVDEIETGLALVGLAATALVVVSGGGSYAVKGGLSALRAARAWARSPRASRGC